MNKKSIFSKQYKLMPELQLFNTLTRKKEKFVPLTEKSVGMYTCGPTVYHDFHIGNLRSNLMADFLKRSLTYLGYNVNHVINITDVGHLVSDGNDGEDKMEKGARREGKSVWEVAEFYTNNFKRDINRLNVVEPNIWCKATDHIKEQIEMIKCLEEKGFTYSIDDGIYFDTSKFKNYTKLGKLNLEGLQEGARVEKNNQKKNPSDFALWKFSPKNEQRQMEWESPWGIGFPGWHIECSAMANKYLGNTIDIHTGGIDLVPVHHTNEIAQSESCNDEQFCNFWIHGEFVVIGDEEEKMAKSGENFITLDKIIEKGFDPISYRFLLLMVHYRSKVNFSWEALESAENGYNRLKRFLLETKETKPIPAKISETFKSFINDDIDLPGAVAFAWDQMKTDLSNAQKKQMWLEFDEIFGLGLKDLKTDEIPKKIIDLAEKRKIARKEKNWNDSDKLRDEIKENGYIIEDTSEGYKLTKS